MDDKGSQGELDALRRENQALREKLHALEDRLLLVSTVVENSPSIIFIKALDGTYLLVNREAEKLYRKTASEILGHRDDDFFSADVVNAVRKNDAEVAARGETVRFDETVPFHGETFHYMSVKFPVYHPDGRMYGVCGIAMDVTDQKREAEERITLHEQVIAAQETALRELSTPLVPIAEGVVAMPLVGAIDSARADRIMTTLLDGIVSAQSHTVILDITGVKTVDTHVAGALVATARAVRLLGAQVVLTGIRPEVAQTLVELDMDMEGIVTRGNFQSGIAFAMKR